jgi:uncharacterized repeat protein (TIGR03803 family)
MFKNVSVSVHLVLVIFLLAVTICARATDEEKVLLRFNGKNGSSPTSGLVFDSAGNLYGTTASGGTSGSACNGIGCGTVFELTPGQDGGWTQKVLHNFAGADGKFPNAGLILDNKGNLYGTTSFGGTQTGCGGRGCGNVFELVRGANGKWTERVLHSFAGKDGARPYASLLFDRAGNLYGTASGGGSYGDGCVFELMPNANGKWTEKVLHSFQSNGTDGGKPLAGLIFDMAGNLYGTTFGGGHLFNGCSSYGCGTIFELFPADNGIWTETILFSFDGPNGTGANPSAGVIFDTAGNLYGTAYTAGYVFQLTPSGNGQWTETVLDGIGGYPTASLIFDSAGNLYGTNGDAAFELKPGTGGQWTETILHAFSLNSKGGSNPQASLIFDSTGNLFSTTASGGDLNECTGGPGCGTVFRLTP